MMWTRMDLSILLLALPLFEVVVDGFDEAGDLAAEDLRVFVEQRRAAVGVGFELAQAGGQRGVLLAQPPQLVRGALDAVAQPLERLQALERRGVVVRARPLRGCAGVRAGRPVGAAAAFFVVHRASTVWSDCYGPTLA